MLNDKELMQHFDAPLPELDGNAFAASLSQEIARRQRKRYLLSALSVIVSLIVVSLFSFPLELATFITNVLTAPVIDLGEGWAGWLLMPLNNPGAMLIILMKLLRVMTPRSVDNRVRLLPF